ncbi:MAG TPA: hypothetical protein PLL26_05350 [Candidatus Dojkabacteria bacterium]|nr:hypothetical protein [Candidatus Dojkabacteria bacterium]
MIKKLARDKFLLSELSKFDEEFIDIFLMKTSEQIRNDVSELIQQGLIPEHEKENVINSLLQMQESLALRQAEFEKQNIKYLN